MEEMVGNKTRIEAAKEAVLEFAKQVPEEATISMRVYGHKGSGSEADKKLSCGSSEKYYEGNYDSEKFKNALNKVKPAGWTPIALALETVKDDIPKNTDDVVVYVVSDGIETCGGNPVKAAKDLVSSDIETIVNIIGFDVDNEGKNLLKKVASAGNGEFTYVDSERELKKYMREQYEQIQKSWLEWKEEGKEQSIQIKERMKKLALSTKESMKKKSEREKERLKSAQAYLKEKYNDREHPSSTMFSKVVNYANEKWRYAVDTGNEAWKQAVDSGNQQWKEYVEEGNKKMNEAGEKKKEHSE
ncbi:vWA domain-containing protein [Numidum massiliense]|uniref:vWA domain-containing protein n=1 Tax=Numidum massiliense TaxID=1522315 RepID=UPI001E2E55AB|nr:VWA domain-containing protein [Numidum massiliense]